LKLSLSHMDPIGEHQPDLLNIDEALERLARLDSRWAQVVELRFFGGLTEKEAAQVLGISTATLKRDWEFARAWLIRQLRS
jgi:DNA-directed RNA polymerase specialized sigma24 family protein